MRAFISYSVAEKRFGAAVKQAMENLGVECFLAHEDIQVSEEWKERILQELREADIFVAVLSVQFKASEWCSQELGFIVARPDVVIVPLSIDHTTPYGFISNLQGQHVSNESAIPGIIEDLLYRKRPRDMIPIQIGRVRRAGSFRLAEAAVRPLVPHFKIFTEQEAADFASAAVSNSEVWDAGLCRSEYLPKFLAANDMRIPDALKKELKQKIEDDAPPAKPSSFISDLLEEEKKRVNRPVRELAIAEDADLLEMKNLDKEPLANPSGWDVDSTKQAKVGGGDPRVPKPRPFTPRQLPPH